MTRCLPSRDLMFTALALLAIALLTPAHTVFAWIGMGLAVGGGGCCSLVFVDSTRLPAGARINYGMLISSAVMILVGLAIPREWIVLIQLVPRLWR